MKINHIHHGDALDVLATLPDESVHCIVTSPPYFNLRDYNVVGQIGREATPEAFIARLKAVFAECRRVLREDGTCWIVIGDSYAHSGKGGNSEHVKQRSNRGSMRGHPTVVESLPAKNLIGIPWRLAFALQDDGWILRQEVIWAKRNYMPESVTDRPTKSHETIFMLVKSTDYYYNSDGYREPLAQSTLDQIKRGYNGHGTKDYEANGVTDPSKVKRRVINGLRKKHDARMAGGGSKINGHSGIFSGSGEVLANMDGANCRDVWNIGTQSFAQAHFATFPERLVSRCVCLGCPSGGVVLDPFMGSGTTGKVALDLACKFIGVELNPEYVEMARRRLASVTPAML